METLCYKIEYLRQRMYVMALEKGRLHSDVLMASQRLDEAMNEFYKLELIKKVR